MFKKLVVLLLIFIACLVRSPVIAGCVGGDYECGRENVSTMFLSHITLIYY